MQNPLQHCRSFHNISKGQFPIKPAMFSHGIQERFCYCPGCLLEVSGFYHTSTNLTRERNTCICWIRGTVDHTASLDTVENRKISCPYQHSKIWETNDGPFLNGYAIPAPTEISKYWSISCMNFQWHCIMAVTVGHWQWSWTTNRPHTVKHN